MTLNSGMNMRDRKLSKEDQKLIDAFLKAREEEKARSGSPPVDKESSK